MLIQALLLSAFLSVSQEDVERLIRQLGADDVVLRNDAARELERMGEPALAALRRVSIDDAEVRALVGAIVRRISLDAYLKRPENKELRARWNEIVFGTFDERRIAIKSWVRDGGASPARIDALLGLFELDPSGPAGSAVGEALSWLCAPRLMSQVERSSTGGVWLDPKPVLEFIAEWAEYVAPWEASIAAQAKMKAGLIPARPADQSHSYLNEIRLICAVCRITFRVDDDGRRLHWEEPGESLAYWKGWWESIRSDRVALMDLGLLKRPDAAALPDADVDAWIERLGSGNPRHARTARSLLKELPDERVAEIGRRAARPGAARELRNLAERLLLRSRGSLLYVSDREGGQGLYVMRLDGSGARKVSGDLAQAEGAHPRKDGLWAFGTAASPAGKRALYRFDLQGSRGPRHVSDVVGTVWTRPDGRKIAIRENENNYTLHVVDAETGKDTVFGEAGRPTSQIRWAPDGSALAWTTERSLYLLPEGEAKPLVVENCDAQYGRFAWSSCSRFIAYCRANRDGDADEWTCRIEAVERTSGKRRVVAGPFWTMSDPEWSPDGARLVYAGNLRADPAAVEVYDLSLEKAVARVVPLRSKGPLQQFVQWMPDGKTVSYHQSIEGKDNGQVIGEHATVFIDAASGTVRAVHRELPVFFAPLPGLEWGLAQNREEDILLWSLDGTRTINLTESPEGEYGEVFLPPPSSK